MKCCIWLACLRVLFRQVDSMALRLKASSVLCIQCDKWIHSRCAGVNPVAPMFSINFCLDDMWIECWVGSGEGKKVM